MRLSSRGSGTAARVQRPVRCVTVSISSGGNAYPGRLASQIDAVASLPTYEEALAKLMSVMNGPITKLTRTLNDVPGKVVRVVAAVKDAKAAG